MLGLRYYCQLRLPIVLLGFVRSSLSSPDTCSLDVFVVPYEVSLMRIELLHLGQEFFNSVVPQTLFMQGINRISPVSELPL